MLNREEKTVKVKIRSTETEKYPVSISVTNRLGSVSAVIKRDVITEVPESIAEALKNTTVQVERPDMEFHEKYPHALGEPPQTVFEEVDRLSYEIYGRKEG